MRNSGKITAAGSLLAIALSGGTAHAGGPTAGVEARVVETLEAPTYVATAPGRPRYLYVTEKHGVVRVLRDGEALDEPFLDISDLVAAQGEQGLLSIAFAPGFRRTRRFYVYFTASSGCSAAAGCPIRVDEFKARRRNPAKARRGTRRPVIAIPHPDAANHNGGTVAFGPDRKLWLATGDGGGGGDQFQNARDPESLLGKLLRINPLRRKPDRAGYRIPPGNPFVGEPGRDEIWSYGLRNPFRFSFDEKLRAIAIGDVGQGNQEEIDITTLAAAKGQGFGWPEFEGTLDYPESPPYTPPAPPLFPAFVYPNPSGGPAAVTGGVVVRDPQLAQLAGRYLTADFYAGQVVSFVPDLANNQADDIRTLDVEPIPNLVAFGAGLDRQLYLVSLSGGLYRLEPE